MNEQQTNTGSEKDGQRKIPPEPPIKYFQQFDPLTRHCIYLSTVLRWFDQEVLLSVIEADPVFQSEYFHHIGPSAIRAAFQEVVTLPYVEDHSNAGYQLHQPTRDVFLDFLWEDEPQFYEMASDAAVQYFEEVVERQIDELEKGLRKMTEVRWDFYIEIAYHALIAYQDESMDIIDELQTTLLEEWQVGVFHEVILALKPHLEAGRAPDETENYIRYWELKEAYTHLDMPRLEELADQILTTKNHSAFFTAEASFLLGDGLRQATRYEEARNYLEDSIYWYNTLDDAIGKTQARLSLGKIELECEHYPAAERHLQQALAEYVEQMRIPYDAEATDYYELSYKIHEPEAWERMEWTFEIPGEEQPETEYESEQADTKVVTYNIAVDEGDIPESWSEEKRDQARNARLMLRLDVILGDLWLYLGYYRLGINEFEEAAACARLAGDIYADFDYINGMQSAVYLLQVLGAATSDIESVKYNRAFQEKLLEQAAQSGDERALLYGLEIKAQLYLDKMLFDAAREQYDRALELAQKLDSANDIAVCLDGLGRLNWTDGHYVLAEEKFNEALQFFRKASNREGWASTLLNLSNLQLNQSRFSEAQANANRALSTYSDLEVFSGIFDALVRLSEINARQNRMEEARTQLEEAAMLSRQKKQYAYQAASLAEQSKLYFSNGDDEGGKKRIARAVNLAQRHRRRNLLAQFLNSVVYTLLETAGYHLALELTEQAIALDPEDREAYHSRGWALENLGPDFAERALEAYRQALSSPPDDIYAKKGMANALLLLGKKAEAQAIYLEIVEQYGRSFIPVQLSAIGWSYYQLGRYREAEETYLKNVESNPDPIADYFDLGLIYLAQNDPVRAQWAYRQGLEKIEEKYPKHLRLGQLFVALSDLQDHLREQPPPADDDTPKKIQAALKKALQKIDLDAAREKLFSNLLD